MRLTNIVARWPGSTHDSFVLTNSSVGNRLEPGIVERAIGQLKSRWRCLDRSRGMLLYYPEKVCRIMQACGVLHNIAHRHGVPLHEVMALRRSRPRTKQCAAQCRSHSNSAALNINKTVEMIVDFRKKPLTHPPLVINNSSVTVVEHFKFLGTTITNTLKWDNNISRKASSACFSSAA
ncbi:putative nuclease HARBI1 [Merluccius polli]|uniref:Nuclease HARBI1 n=1 Tax=Merluccius polli TaxID=89951 RepID=A0AA47MYK5_MERPO|nr:putative nuclease HARBI1 [Merluccius polli]